MFLSNSFVCGRADSPIRVPEASLTFVAATTMAAVHMAALSCTFCLSALHGPTCGVCEARQEEILTDWVCAQCTFAGNGAMNAECAACGSSKLENVAGLSREEVRDEPVHEEGGRGQGDEEAPDEEAPDRGETTTPEDGAASLAAEEEPAEPAAGVANCLETFMCAICGEELNSAERFAGCSAATCGDCGATNARVQIELFREKGSAGTLALTCPMRCHSLSYKQVRDSCGLSREDFAVYSAALRAESLSTASVSCWNCGEYQEFGKSSYIKCYNPGCVECDSCVSHGQAMNRLSLDDPLLDSEKLSSIPHVVVKKASYLGGPAVRFCQACYQNETSTFTSQMAELVGIKSCPKCSMKIEKNGGCKHMTCKGCKHEWFWCCLRAYRDPAESRAHYQDKSEACNAPG